VAAQLTQPSGVESVRRSSPLAVRLGSAAILAAALTVCFVALTLLFPAAPWRGIDAYEASSAATEIVALVPVLLLAPVVVVLMACIHHLAAGSRQVADQLAGTFAAVHATIVTVNYVVQLYVVRLGIGAGEVEGLALLAMPNPRSVFVALEIAGYGFFALMALAAAAAVSGRKLERWIRYAFLVAGAAGPRRHGRWPGRPAPGHALRGRAVARRLRRRGGAARHPLPAARTGQLQTVRPAPQRPALT
jgi:hypothetical protein